ncbi:MAG: hypothetical protein HOO96_20060 [Polyangiaceae bacterium]|nr:hypothetical protein [Polyangiaceae bacterium]
MPVVHTRLRWILSCGGVAWALAAKSSRAADPPAARNEQCASAAEDGQRLQASGKLLDARERFVSCGQSTCPRRVQTDCIRWLEQTDEAMPTVVVRVVRADGEELTSGDVRLDGRPIHPFDGLPIRLDPGPHKLEAQMGESSTSATFVAVQGEKRKLVKLTFAPPAARGDAATPRPPPPVVTPVRWPGWTLVLGGVALGGTGGVLWGLGRSEHDALASSCGQTGTCAESSTRASQAKLVVGDVLVLTGVVALGIGIYFMVRPPTHVRSGALAPFVFSF